jgi:hypothetical protein
MSYIVTTGKGRFLAKLCNKTYGIKSRKQRIESDRERDSVRDSGTRIHSVESSKVAVISRSIEKRFATLGEIARLKD